MTANFGKRYSLTKSTTHKLLYRVRKQRKDRRSYRMCKDWRERFDFFAKCERCGGEPVNLFCPTKLKCPKCKKITWR